MLQVTILYIFIQKHLKRNIWPSNITTDITLFHNNVIWMVIITVE